MTVKRILLLLVLMASAWAPAPSLVAQLLSVSYLAQRLSAAERTTSPSKALKPAARLAWLRTACVAKRCADSVGGCIWVAAIGAFMITFLRALLMV